jgi:glutamate N-acetyltransferase/amino-acid N-acetyltransferase
MPPSTPPFLQTALSPTRTQELLLHHGRRRYLDQRHVLAFATGKAGNAPLTTDEDAGADAFRAALADLCHQLAQLVVRDGEGAQKLIEITVEGAESDAARTASPCRSPIRRW